VDGHCSVEGVNAIFELFVFVFVELSGGVKGVCELAVNLVYIEVVRGDGDGDGDIASFAFRVRRGCP
jgi:hypothetical protein